MGVLTEKDSLEEKAACRRSERVGLAVLMGELSRLVSRSEGIGTFSFPIPGVALASRGARPLPLSNSKPGEAVACR